MTFSNPHTPGCFWYDIAEKAGAADNHLCEQVTCGIASGPVNTVSNLAYLLVALSLWKKNRQFSVFVFLLGIISIFSHASLIYPALILDLSMSLTLVAWLIVWRLKIQKPLVYVMSFFAGAVLFFHLLISFHYPYAWIIGASAGVMIIAEFKFGSWTSRNFRIALLLILGAFLFSALDLHESFCRPSFVVQGHAVWHLFTAIALIYLERHYSDLGKQPQPL